MAMASLMLAREACLRNLSICTLHIRLLTFFESSHSAETWSGQLSIPVVPLFLALQGLFSYCM